MDKKKYDYISGFLQLLLGGSLLLLALQQLCYDSSFTNLTVRMGYYVLTAGLVMAVGCLFYTYNHGEITQNDILIIIGKLYLLYTVAGVCRFWITDERARAESLIQILVLRKIPVYAELYISILIFLIFVILLKNPLNWLLKRIWLSIPFGCLLLGVTFLPSDKLGYKIIGTLLGTEEFRSLTILAFFGYFLIGYYFTGASKAHTALWRIAAVGSLAVTIGFAYVYRYKLLRHARFPFSWWEIVIPIGFVLVLALLSFNQYVHLAIVQLTRKQFYLQSCLVIAILTIIKEKGLSGSLNVLQAGCIFAALWIALSCLCTVADRIIGKIRSGDAAVLWKNRILQSIAAYTAMFAVFTPAVFAPFFDEKNRLIWWTDGLAQYFPKAIWFSGHVRELISSILKGNIEYQFFDFSFGLGDSVTPRLDPFYWMYAVFSPEHMEAGYHWVTIFRLYLIGLAALMMLLYLGKGKWASLMGSCVYLFCGYVLFTVPKHPQFACPMILLPLLIIACEEILRKKEWYLGTLLIGVSLLSSYYFLYISSIGLVIYFLVRFFYLEKPLRTIKNFFCYLLTFTWAWVLGVGIGSLTFFTSFMNYVGSGRNSKIAVEIPSLFYYRQSWPTALFTYFITSAKGLGWLRTGFIPIAYLAVVIMFLRKGRKIEKTLFALCVMLCMFPVAGYILSGFANVTNRWVYLFALLISVIVAETLPQIPNLTNRELAFLSLAALPYVMILLTNESYDKKIIIKAGIVLMVSLVVIILSNQIMGLFNGRQVQVLLTILIFLSVWSSGHIFYRDAGEVMDYIPAGKPVNSLLETKTRVFSDMSETPDDFYRVGEVFPSRNSLNASMVQGVYGLSYYSSTANKSILAYNRAMGNVMFNLVMYFGFNNRTAMNALASTRYYGVLEGNSNEKNMIPFGYEHIDTVLSRGENIQIYKNKYALPLGYTYNHWISADALDTYSEVERQEVMLTHAVVSPDNLKQSYIDEDPVTTMERLENVEIACEGAYFEDHVLRTEEEGGTVSWYFEGKPKCENYLVITGRILPKDTQDSNVAIKLSTRHTSYGITAYPIDAFYFSGINAYVFNLGYSEEPLDFCSIQFDQDVEMEIDWIDICCQPMDNYPAQINALKQEGLKNIQILNNAIKGSVSVSEPKILALSIPYSRNWHIYVDGQEEELLNVNIMYCGVELPPGDHEIEIRYESKAIRNGLIVTGGSLLIFIICIIVGRRKPEKKSNQE